MNIFGDWLLDMLIWHEASDPYELYEDDFSDDQIKEVLADVESELGPNEYIESIEINVK